MSNFEKITASPEALAAFLASLPVATGPWEKEFQNVFCTVCEREDCDGEPCHHQDRRNNPLWWLNRAAARRLAVQEFGTAKGLGPDPATDLEGLFKMEMGSLHICIRPDMGMSGRIELAVGMSTANGGCIGYFNRETLGPDCGVMEKYERKEKREALEQWVFGAGPERRHKLIDEVWSRNDG